MYFFSKIFWNEKIQDNRILLITLILAIYGIFENGVSYNIDFTLVIQLIYLLGNRKKK